jgi:hypothetical protein
MSSIGGYYHTQMHEPYSLYLDSDFDKLALVMEVLGRHAASIVVVFLIDPRAIDKARR